MHVYYVSGFPYSENLEHSGIKGQKWGIRRFQNEDGTWTAAGKIRYGAKKTGEAIGKAAKKVGEFAKKQYKKRHPEAMTDDELRAHISRIKLENEYREMMRQNKKPVSTGRRVVNEILESSAKTLVSGAIQRINDRIRDEEAYDRRVEQQLENWRREDRHKDMRDAQLKARERREERKTLGYQYRKHVRKSLPKKFSDFTNDDWKNFESYSDTMDKIREFEGLKSGGKKGGKKG